MTLRTLVLVAGVGLAALVLPTTAEARHRHNRSCRHHVYSQVDRYPGYGGYYGYGSYDAYPYAGYGYYYDEPRYVYAPVRVRPRHYIYRPRVRHFRPRLHLHFGR